MAENSPNSSSERSWIISLKRNCMGFLAIKCSSCAVLTVFESRDKIVIVMEYASRGELYDYIQERKRLPETEARSIFRQITSAVHYCHKVRHTYALQMCHRY